MHERPVRHNDAAAQNRQISPDTEHAIKEISTFIGMLNDYYMKDKKEGLIFDED